MGVMGTFAYKIVINGLYETHCLVIVSFDKMSLNNASLGFLRRYLKIYLFLVCSHRRSANPSSYKFFISWLYRVYRVVLLLGGCV